MPDAPPPIHRMAQGTAGQLQPSRSHPTASSSHPQKRETMQRQARPGQHHPGAGSEKTRAPRKGVRSRAKPGTATSSRGECAGAPFPGTFTSRCRPRPGARGAARGGLANRASMLAATPLASPSPTRRRAVARPFQGRVSRQRLKAPGLNADHRRRVRTDSSNCSVRKSKPCIQARSGTTLASLAFAIG